MPEDDKTSNIDLFIQDAACMVHSAGTENNIAIAPSTTKIQLATLFDAITKIEETSKLTPSGLDRYRKTAS